MKRQLKADKKQQLQKQIEKLRAKKQTLLHQGEELDKEIFEREKFSDEVLKHHISIKRLIERNMRQGHSSRPDRDNKFGLNFIVASLENQNYRQEVLDYGYIYSLKAAGAIKVISENRLFEDLGMAQFNEADLVHVLKYPQAQENLQSQIQLCMDIRRSVQNAKQTEKDT